MNVFFHLQHNCLYRTANFLLATRYQLLVTSFQLLVTSHQLLVTSLKFLVTSHLLLFTSYQLLVANYQSLVSTHQSYQYQTGPQLLAPSNNLLGKIHKKIKTVSQSTCFLIPLQENKKIKSETDFTEILSNFYVEILIFETFIFTNTSRRPKATVHSCLQKN